MAVLQDADRGIAWIDMMQRNRDAIGLNKIDLRAAIDAADSWADSNAASFNSALPVAARTTLTAKQKALLLMVVVSRRFGIL
jgi:hypothetical protein